MSCCPIPAAQAATAAGSARRRTWRIVERDSRATVCCERTKSPPFGIEGGAAGAPARISVVDPHGAERVLNSKGSFNAPAGGLVVFDVPGSGGYGPPGERDPASLGEDLADGYVTPEGAPPRLRRAGPRGPARIRQRARARPTRKRGPGG